ncbi:hypothetical protein [Opitutus terrae]|uniref:Uncharacterized protein n=1 Tax=Opitutus terrae (strain DSM 11246 / JCM 15787 / PB90-1) TaxID=452637 RepID=B1ZQH7_OPITP|nr:hypothetical protein [Opitutus terrae]ACB75586.1 hypothetical protein Oter_2304 [Opitutus terrae PB90-1]
MKTFSSLSQAAAGIAMLGALLAIVPTEAQARSRTTVVHGSRGAVYQRQVEHVPGRLNASGAVTRPDGRTASRSFSTQKTNAGRVTSARATGFNGKTATYDSSRVRTANGYERQATATGPNGATASKHVSVAREGDTVTRTVTHTNTPPPQ